jgi:hypothetical protein
VPKLDEAGFWPCWSEAMTPVAVGAPLLPELYRLVSSRRFSRRSSPFVPALQPAADILGISVPPIIIGTGFVVSFHQPIRCGGIGGRAKSEGEKEK